MNPLRALSVGLVFFVSLLPLRGAPADVRVASPDGQVAAVVSTDASQRLVIRVERAGKPALESSPLGITVDGVDLGLGVTLGEPTAFQLEERYAWHGLKAERRNHCAGIEVPVKNASGGLSCRFEVRAYDEGIAWRYVVPGEGERQVSGEATTFHLPKDTPVWAQRDTRNYEGMWKRVDEKTTTIGFPIVGELPTGGYVCLTEADVMHYSGMSLRAETTTSFRGIFEDDASWTMRGSFATPWRVCIAVPDLNALVNADLVSNVCPAPDPRLFPQGAAEEWIKPGRSLWQWWAYNDPGTEWSRQKTFIDQAAELGCQYYLVDEGWQHPKQGWFESGRTPWDRMKELADYAAPKGVKLWIWQGWKEDGKRYWPGLETSEKRVAFFAECVKAGVVGVKIDFMDSESQTVLAFYQDCLRLAAEHRIMIDFHGANKPAGEPRTWPNEMTREGLRSLEYNKFGRNGRLTPAHYTVLPFTRFAVGHGDFTPTTFQRSMAFGTSPALQLAAAVVYTSPFLTWADKPELYLQSPAVDLIRTMPTVWNETRVLAGSKIGELAAFARRSGQTWWVGIINGTTAEKEYALDLGFLPAGEWQATIAEDKTSWEWKEFVIGGETHTLPQRTGEEFQPVVRQEVIKAGGSMPARLEPAGGFVVRLERKRR